MSQTYFEFFRLSPQYNIDLATLDANYRKIQSEVHPDKFVTASPAERLQSMQAATLANEAYQTLKNPTSRARYLLKLQGIETLEESNTAMPIAFLMQQMELREAIEDASHGGDIHALDQLLRDVQQQTKQLQNTLAETLGSHKNEDLNQATETVRMLSFLDKIQQDIQLKFTKLDA